MRITSWCSAVFHVPSVPENSRAYSEIMGEAPRLATHLGRRPILLDSVLSADFYDPLGDIEELSRGVQIAPW